jgi:hypothetical protein
VIELTEEQIAAREFRNAAYHESAHKMVYEQFGGAGDALVWKNESGNPEERRGSGSSSSHLSGGSADDCVSVRRFCS